MSIEDTEEKLYKGDPEIERRTKHSSVFESKQQPETSQAKWDEEVAPSDEEMHLPEWFGGLKKTVVVTAVIGGIVLLGAGGYFLYRYFSVQGVGLEITAPNETLVGMPFDFVVRYTNNSGATLKNAKLSVSLPNEFIFVGEDESKRTSIKDVHDIGVGSVGEETFKVMAVSGSRSAKSLDVSLEYGSSFGSRYNRTARGDVFIGDSAANLDIQAADKVLSGEDFEVHVSYKNVSDKILSDLELQLEYPADFTFKTASLKPDTVSNNTWQLGDLNPGSSNEFVIRGHILAPAGSFFDMKAKLVASVGGLHYTVSEQSKTVAISSSPLALAIALNDRTDYITKTNDHLTYVLSYRNNTDTALRDVIVTAHLTGALFDLASVHAEGTFNSVSNTLSWNASNVPGLKLIAPGGSGSIRFDVSTLMNYPIHRLSDKNYTIKVNGTIESPTVPVNVALDATRGVATLETKVAGNVEIAALGLFRDAPSGILNQGTMPPKANQPTQFTVHWQVTNYATDVEDVEIRTALAPGVRATGVITSNIDQKPVYNERTQELVWLIPKLQATRGVIGQKPEAVIQIEATPPITLIGGAMPLTGATSIQAKDSFTGVTLQNSAREVATNKLNDSTVQPSDGMVTP